MRVRDHCKLMAFAVHGLCVDVSLLGWRKCRAFAFCCICHFLLNVQSCSLPSPAQASRGWEGVLTLSSILEYIPRTGGQLKGQLQPMTLGTDEGAVTAHDLGQGCGVGEQLKGQFASISHCKCREVNSTQAKGSFSGD